jgi:hypothetical protein
MKSVAVCASKKYKDQAYVFIRKLEKEGVIVYDPNISQPIKETEQIVSHHVTQTIFRGLTLEHFEKIRKADVCYLYNYQDYMGVSMTLELGFAAALAKPIYALSDKTGDPCRDVLIDRVVKTPNALIKLLQ